MHCICQLHFDLLIRIQAKRIFAIFDLWNRWDWLRPLFFPYKSPNISHQFLTHQLPTVVCHMSHKFKGILLPIAGLSFPLGKVPFSKFMIKERSIKFYNQIPCSIRIPISSVSNSFVTQLRFQSLLKIDEYIFWLDLRNLVLIESIGSCCLHESDIC